MQIANQHLIFIPCSNLSRLSKSSFVIKDEDVPLSQSWVHICASVVIGVNELRYGSRTLSPVLKADSDATVVTGIANTSLAMLARIGYRPEFTFHHSRTFQISL
jgi:hypothetical protein